MSLVFGETWFIIVLFELIGLYQDVSIKSVECVESTGIKICFVQLIIRN